MKNGYDVTCYNRTVKGNKENKANDKVYKGVKLVNCFTIEKKGLSAVTASFWNN